MSNYQPLLQYLLEIFFYKSNGLFFKNKQSVIKFYEQQLTQNNNSFYQDKKKHRLRIKLHIVTGNNSNYIEKDQDFRAIFKHQPHFQVRYSSNCSKTWLFKLDVYIFK